MARIASSLRLLSFWSSEPLFQDLVFFLELHQEEVLLEGPLNGLDHTGRSLLERGAEFHEEGVKKGNPPVLLHPQRHQNEGGQQQKDDQDRNRIAS